MSADLDEPPRARPARWAHYAWLTVLGIVVAFGRPDRHAFFYEEVVGAGVAMDDAGIVVAVWNSLSEVRFSRYTAARGWSVPVRVGPTTGCRPSFGSVGNLCTSATHVGLDAAGNATVVWWDASSRGGTVMARRWLVSTETWEAEPYDVFDELRNPECRLVVTPDGGAFVGCADRHKGGIEVARFGATERAWTTHNHVSPDSSELLRGMTVQLEATDGTAVVMYPGSTSPDPRSHAMFAMRWVPGGWREPQVIEGGYALAMSQDGTAIVVAGDTRTLGAVRSGLDDRWVAHGARFVAQPDGYYPLLSVDRAASPVATFVYDDDDGVWARRSELEGSGDWSSPVQIPVARDYVGLRMLRALGHFEHFHAGAYVLQTRQLGDTGLVVLAGHAPFIGWSTCTAAIYSNGNWSERSLPFDETIWVDVEAVAANRTSIAYAWINWRRAFVGDGLHFNVVEL